MILAQGFQRFVLDLDGVVWRGDRAVLGSPETIRALRDHGRRFAFVTNNSSQLAETVGSKLARMGAGGDPEEIVTSAHATARLLTDTIPEVRGRTAFVIGGPGLVEAVREVGVVPVHGDDAPNAALVIVGLDVDLTYEKLSTATLAIRKGARFIASNDDATMPSEEGQVPGAGSIVAALAKATGAKPLIAGKPNPIMFEVAAERLQGAPSLVVGDRVETDIAAAEAIGWPNALVLTGATGVPELAAASIWPDFILRSFADVLADLPHPTVRGAAGSDLPTVATLLHSGGLHAGSVRERVGRTVVAEAGRGQILATAAWEPFEDIALLRSVATLPQAQKRGIGMVAVAGALRQITQAGIRDVYLLTESAAAFFARCGFETIDREDLPKVIASSTYVARECTTATPMRVRLPEPSPAQARPADDERRRGSISPSKSMPATKPPTWAK